jgi:hypothetical protein
VDNIPKSSPAARNGIEDLYYEIAHGKGALMEKKERERKKQALAEGGDNR